MKKRVRTCTARCWNAKGTKCRCVCGGAQHGSPRVFVNQEQHKEDETAYIEQKEFPLEVASVK